MKIGDGDSDNGADISLRQRAPCRASSSACASQPRARRPPPDSDVAPVAPPDSDVAPVAPPDSDVAPVAPPDPDVAPVAPPDPNVAPAARRRTRM